MRIVATMQEQFAINEKLKDVCKPSVDGFCAYADGWNDKAVAEAIAPRLNGNHVALVRRNMGYGVIKPTFNAGLPREVVETLERIEAGYAEHRGLVMALAERYAEFKEILVRVSKDVDELKETKSIMEP
jgi:hypothetical protein